MKNLRVECESRFLFQGDFSGACGYVSDSVSFFAVFFQFFQNRFRKVRRDDQYEADTHIKYAEHFGFFNGAELLKKFKNRWNPPTGFLYNGVTIVRQDPGDIANEASSGYMCHGPDNFFDFILRQQFYNRLDIYACRLKQNITKRSITNLCYFLGWFKGRLLEADVTD